MNPASIVTAALASYLLNRAAKLTIGIATAPATGGASLIPALVPYTKRKGDLLNVPWDILCSE